MKGRYALILLLVLLVLTITGCTSEKLEEKLPPGESQSFVYPEMNEEMMEHMMSDNQGEVWVDIIPQKFAVNDRYISFLVYLNTHSVDLSKYNLDKMTRFENSSGLVLKEGIEWQKTSDMGHHITGIILIPAEYKGTKVINDNTKYISLVIEGLAGIKERRFTWDKNHIQKLLTREGGK